LRGGGAGYAQGMEKIEREVEEVARGRDEATPFKALFGVGMVVALVAGLVILAGVLIWVFVG
jgi:hypothetical protein